MGGATALLYAFWLLLLRDRRLCVQPRLEEDSDLPFIEYYYSRAFY